MHTLCTCICTYRYTDQELCFLVTLLFWDRNRPIRLFGSENEQCAYGEHMHTEAVTRNSTGVRHPRGVHQSSRTGKWIAKINIRGKSYYLGSFDTMEEAQQRYEVLANLRGRASYKNALEATQERLRELADEANKSLAETDARLLAEATPRA